MKKIKFDRHCSLRYATYLRMSSDAQNPRSPEQQVTTIRDEIKHQGLTWVEVRNYEDLGITGRVKSKRPSFMTMLEDVRSGRIHVDVILVDTSERLGRSDDISHVRQFLKKHGVLLLDAKNHFADPTTSAGELFAVIDSWRGNQESEIKGHMVRRGKRDAIQQGFWPGGPTPLGYELVVAATERRAGRTIEKKKLAPAPSTRFVVERMYEVADEKGMGASRIAKELNHDPSIPQELKPFLPNTVDHILDNRIYIGEMVWERNTTGYVDDVRVIEPNQTEEWQVVKDYCQPLITIDRWNRVQELRAQRSATTLSHRKPAEASAKNGLRGIALKYPLSGLVICGVCGHAMVAYGRKPTDKHPGSPVIYRCPHVAISNCTNRTYFTLEWLMERVMALVTQRLFFGMESVSADVSRESILASATFHEFQRLVELEIGLLEIAQPSEQECLMAEEKGLRSKQTGWMESLSANDLHPSFRHALQNQFTGAAVRIEEIQQALSRATSACQLLTRNCSPECVADVVSRLGSVLLQDNPSATNLELARHIDAIRVTDDGKVQIRMCKLGFLIDAESMPPAVESASTSEDETATSKPKRMATRPRRLIVDEEAKPWEFVLRGDYSLNPHRFDHLSDEWFWVDEFEIPVNECWSVKHALEVAQSRLTAPCSQGELAQRFGKSKPTIETALKNAKSMGVDATKISGRSLRPNWAKDRADDVAAYFSQPGATMAAAVKYFGMSDCWIRKSRKIAEAKQQLAPSNPPEDKPAG